MNMKAISTRLRATNVFMSARLRYLQFIGDGWYFWMIKYKHIHVRVIIPGCCPDFITWLYNSSHEPKPILPWYPSSEIGRNGYHLDKPGSLIWIGHCWRLWSIQTIPLSYNWAQIFLFISLQLNKWPKIFSSCLILMILVSFDNRIQF